MKIEFDTLRIFSRTKKFDNSCFTCLNYIREHHRCKKTEVQFDRTLGIDFLVEGQCPDHSRGKYEVSKKL